MKISKSWLLVVPASLILSACSFSGSEGRLGEVANETGTAISEKVMPMDEGISPSVAAKSKIPTGVSDDQLEREASAVEKSLRVAEEESGAVEGSTTDKPININQ